MTTPTDSKATLLELAHKLGKDDLRMSILGEGNVSLRLSDATFAVKHAWLLGLPNIQCVGHVHAIAVNQILCSPRADEFARWRIFPDEIVCCGTESVFVPYTDPGVALAQAIRQRTIAFVARTKREPRIILLQNHGVIAIGSSTQAVLASLLMVEKAAQIFVGAAALGGPVFLYSAQAMRIAGRSDEHYRQGILKL